MWSQFLVSVGFFIVCVGLVYIDGLDVKSHFDSDKVHVTFTADKPTRRLDNLWIGNSQTSQFYKCMIWSKNCCLWVAVCDSTDHELVHLWIVQ